MCDIIYFLLWSQPCFIVHFLHVFYAACMFYGTAFMYNHAILCIVSPILKVEINIIFIQKINMKMSSEYLRPYGLALVVLT